MRRPLYSFIKVNVNAIVAAFGGWNAVNDGVCARMDLTCMDGTEVATVEECLAMFNECYEMSSGAFCGVP